MSDILEKPPHPVLDERGLHFCLSHLIRTPWSRQTSLYVAFGRPCTFSRRRSASQKCEWCEASGAMDCARSVIVLATHHAVYFFIGLYSRS